MKDESCEAYHLRNSPRLTKLRSLLSDVEEGRVLEKYSLWIPRDAATGDPLADEVAIVPGFQSGEGIAEDELLERLADIVESHTGAKTKFSRLEHMRRSDLSMVFSAPPSMPIVTSLLDTGAPLLESHRAVAFGDRNFGAKTFPSGNADEVCPAFMKEFIRARASMNPRFAVPRPSSLGFDSAAIAELHKYLEGKFDVLDVVKTYAKNRQRQMIKEKSRKENDRIKKDGPGKRNAGFRGLVTVPTSTTNKVGR